MPGRHAKLDIAVRRRQTLREAKQFGPTLYGERPTVKNRAFATLAVFAGIATAQTQDILSGAQSEPRYDGPTILSRDRSLVGERSGKLLDYRIYGEVMGIYDSSLTPVATDQAGNLIRNGGSYGVEAGFGVTGTKTWRRDKLAVDYHGSYRHYFNQSFFDGVDQFVNMKYTHAFSRRMKLETRETAGTSSQSNGGLTYVPLQNTDLYAVPTNELFDNRTEYLESRVDLTWQKSLRLSINVGGEGFLVRRRSLALASLNGYNGHADVSYRVSKRQTITASVERTHFDFLRQFGNANITQFAGGYSIGLGRRWDFSTKFGAARVDALGLTSINLDPAIAAIVGQNTAVVVFHKVSYIPIVEVQGIRRFERSSLTAAFNQSFSPGNGVYLTSKQSAATIGYSYTGLKKLTFSASAAYSRLQSLGQTLGNFNGYSGGVGSTYKLVGNTHLEARYDYRRYTTGVGFKQNSNRVSIGLAFSPGQKPLAIW
jgi:hypothetical protein